MGGYGKFLIAAGALLIILGVLLVCRPQIPWLGRLPGDLAVKKEHVSFYFPVTTCILISLILTLISRFFKK